MRSLCAVNQLNKKFDSIMSSCNSIIEIQEQCSALEPYMNASTASFVNSCFTILLESIVHRILPDIQVYSLYTESLIGDMLLDENKIVLESLKNIVFLGDSTRSSNHSILRENSAIKCFKAVENDKHHDDFQFVLTLNSKNFSFPSLLWNNVIKTFCFQFFAILFDDFDVQILFEEQNQKVLVNALKELITLGSRMNIIGCRMNTETLTGFYRQLQTLQRNQINTVRRRMALAFEQIIQLSMIAKSNIPTIEFLRCMLATKIITRKNTMGGTTKIKRDQDQETEKYASATSSIDSNIKYLYASGNLYIPDESSQPVSESEQKDLEQIAQREDLQSCNKVKSVEIDKAVDSDVDLTWDEGLDTDFNLKKDSISIVKNKQFNADFDNSAYSSVSSQSSIKRNEIVSRASSYNPSGNFKKRRPKHRLDDVSFKLQQDYKDVIQKQDITKSVDWENRYGDVGNKI